MSKRIEVFQPTLGEEEAVAVREVMLSNWIGRGPKTQMFEHAWATRLGVPANRVMTLNSCTAGLFLLARHLGWGPGDEVVMPSISFVGAANAVLASGARPVFADVDDRSLNTRLHYLKERVTPRTKAVILLHYAGVPCCDLPEIVSFCWEKRITLIEDNACSPFSYLNGQPTGTFGDYGLWSFDAMKILSTGDGGLLYTKSSTDELCCESYLGQVQVSGLTASQQADRQRPWWELQVRQPGRRDIMNDLAAAIGLVQLSKVDGFLARRKEIHERYMTELDAYARKVGIPPFMANNVQSSYYLFHVDLECSGLRNRVAWDLRRENIYTNFRYYPLHRVPLYDSRSEDQRRNDCPSAEWAAEKMLCLPLHQGLSDDDVSRVIAAVKTSVGQFSK